MNLRQLLFTKNDCYKAGRKITPKGIMVHSTGANNPTLRRYVGPDDGKLGANSNNNHWNVGGLAVCVHAFIGKMADGSIATYQVLPWNMRGWHCGGAGNNTHISFEICEDGLGDKSYFKAVYQEAVELCVMLCEQYGIKPENVICHSEGAKRGIASNHADVMHWFPRHGKTMDDFRADVAREMEEEDMGKIFNSLAEVPSYGKPTVEKLIKKGALKGDETGLNINDTMLRILVINDRMGLYG